MKRRSLESYLDDDAAEVPQQENDLPEDRVVVISLRRTLGVSRRLRLGVEVDHRRVGQRLQQQRRLVRRHRRRDDVHVLASFASSSSSSPISVRDETPEESQEVKSNRCSSSLQRSISGDSFFFSDRLTRELVRLKSDADDIFVEAVA